MTHRLRIISRITFCCGVLAGLVGCNGEPSESGEPAPTESSDAEGNGEAGGEDEAQITLDSREGWPTEQEAIDTILKVEREIRASPSNREIWHITDLRHEVHSVEFADRTDQMLMDLGSDEVTVYPARILFTRITEYSDQPDTVEECGADGTWWIYRDAFGDWTAKYGTN
jgi:hypothetical protein